MARTPATDSLGNGVNVDREKLARFCAGVFECASLDRESARVQADVLV